MPTLWQRLRQIKKKDLAFILAGLSVLILAPVAQHYMLSPTDGESLEPGFSTREGGKGGEVFEPGLGGFAPGSAPGGTDVITPLSARDPSSLLMPPGGPPAPPKASAAADGIRDALNRALRQGSEKAVESAGLPTPMPRMASTLRGLAGLAGGSGNVAPLPIGSGAVLEGAKSVPSMSGPKSYAGPIAPSDFKGAERAGATSSAEAMEALKGAADKAAGHFGGHGKAFDALNAAASESVSGRGKDTGGMNAGPGDEGKDKPNAGNNIGGGRFELGENLQMQLMKMRAQKEMDLEFKKREMVELLPYKMWEKFIEMGMEKIVGDGFMKGMGDCVGKTMSGEGCFSSEPTKEFLCYNGPEAAKKLNNAKIVSKYKRPDGVWEIVYKGGGEKDEPQTYECKELISLHDKLEAKPDSAAGRQREVREGVRQQIGTTSQGLDSLINDPGASPEVKKAAATLREAMIKAAASIDQTDLAEPALGIIKEADTVTLKAAHNEALDLLHPQGKAGAAMAAFTTKSDAVQAAFTEGKKPAPEYKALHDGMAKDFETAMNAFSPAQKRLGEVNATLAASKKELETKVDGPLKIAEDLWGASAKLRDDAKKQIDKIALGEAPTTSGKADGAATTVGKGKQLKANLEEVNALIKTAGDRHQAANADRYAWKNTVHTDIGPKLASTEASGAEFVKNAPRLQANASAELDPKFLGADEATRKAKVAAASQSRVDLGKAWAGVETAAGAAHGELTKEDPLREAWRPHAGH